MQLIRIAIFGLLIGGTTFAGVATWRNFGAQQFKHPQGISLRQDSLQKGRAGFFPYYARSRGFRGGGLSGGK